MRPFEDLRGLAQTRLSRPVLDTPLGGLSFKADLGGTRVELLEQFGSGLPCLRRFRGGSSRADLLLFEMASTLHGGHRVDRKVAAVWRIFASEDLPRTVLRAEWEPGARNEDGGYDGGQHLFALTWDAPGVRLSVGTTDEDHLCYLAHQGRLVPPRLQDTYDRLIVGYETNLEYMPRAVRERDGVEVEIPPLLAGEGIQIHFVVAWKTGEFDAMDVSTWFAVDVDPSIVARRAEQALGEGT
jgi:hypothetical protein